VDAVPTKYDWPSIADRSLIGKRISRLDGPVKSTGQAKYSYDLNPEGLLTAKMVFSPHAHARIMSMDLSAAEKQPGVRGVVAMANVGDEVQWAGTEIAAIAADTEEQARDAVANFKVEYEVLPHLVREEDLTKVGNRLTPPDERTEGDPDAGFAQADVIHEGFYGLATITHCCLEPHGQIVHWKGDEIILYASTQAVSRIGGDLAKNLSADAEIGNVSPNQIHVITQHMGGGFGSKFSIDTWGVACAKLSKKTGKPVKLMLDRDQEIMVGGARPSDYGNIKVGAKKDGTLVAYQSETLSTGVFTSSGTPPLPYVIDPPNRRSRNLNVSTNTVPARAWRPPNHPQASLLTMCAM
jgi:xanthine dehydrogenase YagR molybdenum-binding subunit